MTQTGCNPGLQVCNDYFMFLFSRFGGDVVIGRRLQRQWSCG
jgi:hypothetical protein